MEMNEASVDFPCYVTEEEKDYEDKVYHTATIIAFSILDSPVISITLSRYYQDSLQLVGLFSVICEFISGIDISMQIQRSWPLQ